MSDKNLKLVVSFNVTEPQALALQAMFEHWNMLGSLGSSRFSAFFCDGDGNFHPNCKFRTSKPIKELTDEYRKLAKIEDKDGDTKWDWDGIAWTFHDD